MHIYPTVQETKAAQRVIMFQRHAVVTRLTHWLNAGQYAIQTGATHD